MSRPLIVTALLMLCGCGEGHDVKQQHARAYFERHRAELERVVAAIDHCRPTDGRFDRDFRAGCLHGEFEEELLAAVHDTDARIIWYSTEGNDEANGALKRVRINVYGMGMAYAGVMTSYEYTSAPTPDDGALTTKDHGAGAVTSRLAVDDPPYHWHWERLVR